MFQMRERTGYSSDAFADVYRNFGTPRPLPACGGAVLLRPIADTGLTDAVGFYPLFSCQNWDNLSADLMDLGRECVSLVLVADPFAPIGEPDLELCRNLGDGVNQAADWFSEAASIPSQNFTPLMIFGN